MHNKIFPDSFFQLRPWHEVVGKCIEIETQQLETIITLEINDKQVAIHLSNSSFNCTNYHNLKNNRITILRTDDCFLLRELEPKKLTNKMNCNLLAIKQGN